MLICISYSHYFSQIWLQIPMKMSMNTFFSIVMFFRFYWLCRVLLLHSRLFTDAASRSIAGLNRVKTDSRFILKTMCQTNIGERLKHFENEKLDKYERYPYTYWNNLWILCSRANVDDFHCFALDHWWLYSSTLRKASFYWYYSRYYRTHTYCLYATQLFGVQNFHLK